jgi:hypothetical protein
MIVFDRHVAPAEKRLPFLGDDARENLLDARPRAGVGRQEHGAGAIAALWREVETGCRSNPAQEAIRHLDQDAGAVAGVHFASARAAVLQVDQYLEAAGDDGVGSPSGDIDDEPNTAGVVLERRIV